MVFYQETEFKDSDIGKIPKDWEVMNFEKVIQKNVNYSVGKIKRLEYKASGKFPIIDQGQDLIGGYWDNEKDVFSGELPVIIFGDHTRTFKYVDFRFVCGADGVKIIFPNKEKTTPLFLYYALLSLKIPNRGYNRHYNLLREFSLPIPPIEEQKAIAEVLKSVQQSIEEAEEVIRATKEFKKSMMRHLFTYGYVGVGEKDRVKLKQTEIGLIPEHWEVVKLGEMADIKQGKQLSSNEDTTGKFLKPFVRTSNVLWNKIDLKTISYMYFSEKELGKYRLKNGDVLICEGGEVGRSAVWENNLEECYHQNHVFAVRCKNIINNYFLSYFMEFAITIRHLFTSNANRTTIPNLSKARLKQIPIPLPPLEEQQAIAEVLQVIDNKIQKEENKKQALENLFKSMLYHLINGKIRIKLKKE